MKISWNIKFDVIALRNFWTNNKKNPQGVYYGQGKSITEGTFLRRDEINLVALQMGFKRIIKVYYNRKTITFFFIYSKFQNIKGIYLTRNQIIII